MDKFARVRITVGLAAILFGSSGHSLRADTTNHVQVDRGDAGMVVSDTAVASRIGRQVLVDGGNAVDAAVATAFALAVSWPEAGNIGGGGFMIVRTADGEEAVCVDYREVAPLAMTATSFQRDDTTFSQKAVGVPGTVRGMAAAHRRYGQLPWSRLVAPAAKLAADGIVVDQSLARSLNAVLQQPSVKQQAKFAELRRVYGTADGSPWQIGQVLVLPELSRTLSEIAEHGPDAFYTGRLAELLVQEMQRGNGLISAADLQRYRAKIRPALRGTFRGYTILGAPPPSSGGTCVIEALNILENFELSSRDRFDPKNIHLIAESCRRVFADRARFLADPDFAEIPPHLTTKAYAKELANSIQRGRATPSETVAPEIPLTPESNNTTHFSVIDANGMAVSNTYTLEATWGSRLVVAGAGYVLNNEMGDFNWFPGETNRLGRIGTAANLVAPGKRMLSSQTPTIIERDGKVVLVTGSPGGRTIINTVLSIVLNVTEFSMDAATAVAVPRMHHQWFPDQVELERLDQPPHKNVIDALRERGHKVINRPLQGSAHTIAIDAKTGDMIGVADYRRGGRPAAISNDRLAVWDFAESAGTALSSCRSSGLKPAHWSGDFGTAKTDGLDRLRISDCPQEGMQATFDLPSNASQLTCEVKIDSAHLHGETTGEQLRIEWLDPAGNSITAGTLGRFSDQQITFRSEQEDKSPPQHYTTLSTDGRLATVLLNLVLDTEKNQHRLFIREAAQPDWQLTQITPIDPGTKATKIRLTLVGPLREEDEFILLDRIDIRCMTKN
ncbi:MAG: gamma-glutamyltransferase [Planctomycetota bacterium]|nr:gamma-glutamyltransferase [Planctomycetota bacterium]